MKYYLTRQGSQNCDLNPEPLGYKVHDFILHKQLKLQVYSLIVGILNYCFV